MDIEELEAESAVKPEVEENQETPVDEIQEESPEEVEEPEGFNGTPFSELDEENKAQALEELQGREELTDEEAAFLKDNGIEVSFGDEEEPEKEEEQEEEEFQKPAYAEIIDGVTGQEFKSREEYENAVTDFLKKESETSTKLAEVLDEYPEFKGILSDLMNGESPNAIALLNKHFDLQNMIPEKGDEDYEEFVKAEVQRKIQAEKAKERSEQIKNNQQESTKLLKSFAQEKSLNSDQQQAFYGKVHQFITDINNGKVNKEYLEMMYNGANYGKDIEAAKAQAEIKARNENILTVKRKKKGLVPNVKSNQTEVKNKDPYGGDDFLRNLDQAIQTIK